VWAIVVTVVGIYVGIVVSVAHKLQDFDKVIAAVSFGFQSFVRKLVYVGLGLGQ